MTIRVHADALGVAAKPTSSINAMLHRFELIDGVLVRRTVGDVQPRLDRARYLIDVLLYEDETGRYIAGVRGFTVASKGLIAADPLKGVKSRRTFEVAAEFRQEISSNLGVGPHFRPPAALTGLGELHVG